MSYEPTNWKTGDVVTSAKLNKLEQGVADAGGSFVTTVTATYDPDEASMNYERASHTASEILAAHRQGQICTLVLSYAVEEVDQTRVLYLYDLEGDGAGPAFTNTQMSLYVGADGTVGNY